MFQVKNCDESKETCTADLTSEDVIPKGRPNYFEEFTYCISFWYNSLHNDG